MQKRNKIFLFVIILFTVFSCQKDDIPTAPEIIPVPVSMEVGQGYFSMDDDLVIQYEEGAPGAKQVAEYLADRLSLVMGSDVQASTGTRKKDVIFLKINPSLSELGLEGYHFISSKRQVMIEASTSKGLFYGVQTLFQMLPEQIYGSMAIADMQWKVPAVEITDYPRYSWRGMHLDVSRHFFPKEFVKKYIDLIAMHKMNIFHWHLTDDNGWRIEIKKYPLLTDVAAWRVDREDQPWRQREKQQPGEEATYGGFYTQGEIREIIQYAADRQVMIIPEIEMPGHSSEVFAAYPEYSCREEKLTVLPGSYWPNSDIFCAGKEETFQFLEDILTEVSELFPSPYVHIGGDEADKTLWKTCRKCQDRIKAEGLANEDELQSYFIRRIEKVLQSKGKKLIGWDEILEGGLAPEATVMSWRGFEGGIESARMGHDVIMCPTSHCYFDYYQGDPETEPEAIGGYTTLKKVYSFRPTPPVLNEQEAKHILGAQGNVWTEYIPSPAHAEYMALPRMTALAEVVWSPDSLLDWHHFQDRLEAQLLRLDQMDVNYCEGSFKVVGMPVFDQGDVKFGISMEVEAPGTKIFYTTDETEPGPASMVYDGPIKVEKDIVFNTIAYKNGEPKGHVTAIPVSFHQAIGKPYTYTHEPSFKYLGDNDHVLVDGMNGSLYFNDGKWIGLQGDDLEVTIDLGEMAAVEQVRLSFLHDQGRWIFAPTEVQVLYSMDGSNFGSEVMKMEPFDIKSSEAMVIPVALQFEDPAMVRFIRIKAVSKGTCPSWHPGAGGKAWIFTDEIVIR